MNCQQFRSTISAQNDDPVSFSPSTLADQGEHTKTCFDCVRWLEEQMDAEDEDRGVMTAIPIPGEAASAIEKEATSRLDRTNAHLRRTAAELHKMMVWHQYAAAAVTGILSGGGLQAIHTKPAEIANQACEIADAMMEQIRQRKLM